MRRIWILPFLPLLLAAQQSPPNLLTSGEFATVETTADGSAHSGKFDGSQEILTAAGPDDAVLLRFRNALIESWSIQKAVVAVHVPPEALVPAQITVFPVSAEWTEGSATAPNLKAGMAVPTRTLKAGWITFELPAAVARQLASGAVSSIAISVAAGQSISMHSRRTGQFAPYLLVRGEAPLLRKLLDLQSQ